MGRQRHQPHLPEPVRRGLNARISSTCRGTIDARPDVRHISTSCGNCPQSIGPHAGPFSFYSPLALAPLPAPAGFLFDLARAPGECHCAKLPPSVRAARGPPIARTA